MYKIAVSPEHLEALGYSVEKFKDCISREYEHLKNQTKAFQSDIDNVTGSAVVQSVQAIGGIIADDVESLNNVTKSVHAYADKLRKILYKVESHTNTPGEKTAGVVSGVVMQNCIKETDAGYQTAGSSTLKTIASGVISVAENMAGVKLAPTDSVQVDNAIDGIVRLVDGQVALKHPEKRIDRSATKIPQEQIDSHTLVIDDPDKP